MILSYTQPGPDGTALSGHRKGDTLVFSLNSQDYKNAAWTSLAPTTANSNLIKGYIDKALGITPKNSKNDDVVIPSVSIGDWISLLNGEMDPGIAGKNIENTTLLDPNGPIITIPIINGDPAYNQQGQVVGFIGIKLTSIVKKGGMPGQNLTFTGTLQQSTALGDSVPSITHALPALESYTLGPVKLIR